MAYVKEEISESLAEALVQFHARCEEIVKPLTEAEILNQADHFREHGKPITDFLMREIRIRRMFAKAAEYMDRTGSSYYCFRCNGACTPEHEAED